MRNDRFQNHVSESSLTLPLCVILATGLWFLPESSQELWTRALTWMLCVLTGYVILETNSTYSILRIRTRMMSSVWCALIAVSGFMHGDVKAGIIVFCTAISMNLLFGCYQEREPVMKVFNAFLLVGIEAMIQPLFAIQVLLYYWYLIVFLRSLTWRCFWAGAIGAILPFWFVLGWCILSGDYRAIVYLSGLINPLQPIISDNYMHFSLQTVSLWAGITLVSIVSLINFLSNYYNDKIKTRMLLYIYVMQAVVFWIILILQPQLFQSLMPIILVCVTPLMAHFFALTGSISSNLFFCLSLLIMIGLGVLCFMPEIPFSSVLSSKSSNLNSQLSTLNSSLSALISQFTAFIYGLHH